MYKMALQDLLAARWLLPEDQSQIPQTEWITLSQHLIDMKPMFDQATPEEKLWFISGLMTAALPAQDIPQEIPQELPPEMINQLPPLA